MGLRAGSVEVADDRGHAGLVAHHGCKVDGLLRVVFGEPAQETHISLRSRSLAGQQLSAQNANLHLRLDLSSVARGALAREVRQRTMARGLVFCISVSSYSCRGIRFKENWRLDERNGATTVDDSLDLLSDRENRCYEQLVNALTSVRHGGGC